MTETAVGQAEAIIVSGLPRSGTSMAMKMLQAGGIPVLTDGIRKADEDNQGGYFEFEAVKKVKTDSAWLKDAGGKAVKLVYRLLYDLPASYRYRVLFMRRKLEEVMASQRIMLQRQGIHESPIDDAQFIRLFSAELAKVTAWLKQQPNFQVLYLDYHQLVLDPKPQLAAVNDFLGGRLDVDAAAAVADTTQYRNRS